MGTRGEENVSLQRPATRKETVDLEKIRFAFNAHCQELHDADWGVCDDVRCGTTFLLEQEYEERGEGWEE